MRSWLRRGFAGPPPSADALDPRQPVVTALAFGLAHLLLTFLVRVFDALTLLRALPSPEFGLLTPPGSLPWLLGEEVLVGLVLGALVGLLTRWRPSRPLAILLAGGWFLYLAADQLAFKHYFSHYTITLWREFHDLAGGWSSVVASLDAAFYILTALALALGVGLWLPVVRLRVRNLALRLARRPALWLLLAGVYCGFSCWLGGQGQQYGLERSVAVELLRGLWPTPADEFAASGRHDWLDFKLRHGSARPPEDFSALERTLAASPERLNVFLYVAESMSYRESSLPGGSRHDTTPYLRQLAARGLLFDSFQVTVPASTRSDLATFTGVYPYQHVASAERYAHIDLPLLADYLHEAGWTTALYSSSDTRYDSFDFLLLSHDFDRYLDTNALTQEQRDGHLAMTWGTDEEFMIDQALEWIREQQAAGRPFFLQYKATYPHHPYLLPPGRDRFSQRAWDPQKQAYQASLAYADSALERAYTGLERLGLAQSTLFVYLSDHGECFGDLHPLNKNHGGYVWDEAVRVPLLLVQPRLWPAGRVSRRIGNNLDVVPTVLQLVGLQPSPRVQGQSLVSTRYAERPLFFSTWKQYGLRDGSWKVVWTKTDQQAQLFDLELDPTEQHDRAAEHPQLVQEYQQLIRGWKTSIDELYEQLVLETRETPEMRLARNLELRRRKLYRREDPVARLEICEAASKTAAPTCPTGTARPFRVGSYVVLRIHWREPGLQAGFGYLTPPKGSHEYLRCFIEQPEPVSEVRFTTRLDRPGNWRVELDMGRGMHTHPLPVVAR